jgi:hypothetical protein
MAHHLLGLGLKFIPKPTYTSTTAAIEQMASKLEQDVSIKTFFAGDNDDSSTVNTLHIKNTLRRPPLPPTDIDTRIQHFTSALHDTLRPKRTRSNLTPFQQKLLSDIKSNPTIVIANADKGLGPVGVNKEQYVAWGLQHPHPALPPNLPMDERTSTHPQ